MGEHCTASAMATPDSAMATPDSPLSLHSVGDMEIGDDAIEIDGGGVVRLEGDPEELKLHVEPVEPNRPAVRKYECAGMPASAHKIEWNCLTNGFNPEATDSIPDGATDGPMNEDEVWYHLTELSNHARTGILLAAARDIATQDGVAAPAPVAADDAVASAPAAAAAPAAIPEEDRVKPDYYKCLTCEKNREHWVIYSTSGNNNDGNPLRWCRRCGDRKGQKKSAQHRSWISATNAEFNIHKANVEDQAVIDAEIHAAEGKESKKRKKEGKERTKRKKT